MFQGDGLSRILRAASASRSIRRASTPRWPAPRRFWTRRRTRRTTPRFSSPTPGTSSSRWAGPGAVAGVPRRLRARDLHRVGRQPALRAVRRCAGGASRVDAGGHSRRADFELASLPRFVPVPFRAARVRGGVRLVRRSRVHEAASEHLSGGARATRCGAGRGGDGRRQRELRTSRARSGPGCRQCSCVEARQQGHASTNCALAAWPSSGASPSSANADNWVIAAMRANCPTQ